MNLKELEETRDLLLGSCREKGWLREQYGDYIRVDNPFDAEAVGVLMANMLLTLEELEHCKVISAQIIMHSAEANQTGVATISWKAEVERVTGDDHHDDGGCADERGAELQGAAGDAAGADRG